MGSNFSYEAPSPKAEQNIDDKISDTISSQKTDNLNYLEYIYLVNYNDDFYFTRNNEEIIDVITSLKQQYVQLALNNWNVYNYQIYEKVYNKYQKVNLEDNKIEEILRSCDFSNTNNENKQMQEVYSLDISKSIKHIILHVETNLEKLRVYRVYNLTNIFEVESESEDENKEEDNDKNEDKNEDKEESKSENSDAEYKDENKDTDSEAEVVSENNDVTLESKKNL